MNGKKTYLVAGVAILYAISGFFFGALDANAAVQIVIAALGLGTVRHGISKAGAK